jgi:hypothetical protein
MGTGTGAKLGEKPKNAPQNAKSRLSKRCLPFSANGLLSKILFEFNGLSDF